MPNPLTVKKLDHFESTFAMGHFCPQFIPLTPRACAVRLPRAMARCLSRPSLRALSLVGKDDATVPRRAGKFDRMKELTKETSKATRKDESLPATRAEPGTHIGPNSVWNFLKRHAVELTFVISVSMITTAIALTFGVPSRMRMVSRYSNRLGQLQDEFKNQTGRFWKVLKSRGTVHLRTESPVKPLVVLFAGPPSARQAMDCFSKKFTALLDPENTHQLMVIDSQLYLHPSGDEGKEQLDSKLKEAFDSGRQAALIRKLDKLPLPAALLFYSFCDNENAPYKHAAMVFTVPLPRELDPSLSPVECEGLVEGFLVESLGDGTNHDAVAALVSRISDTTVLINGEDENNLKKVCAFP